MHISPLSRRILTTACLGLMVGLLSQPTFAGPIPQPGPQLPIVGGVPESGWPSVGAMTIRLAGLGYMGSYCTGTLIAPQWVLTAAHCLKSSPEMPINQKMAAFFSGPDANFHGMGETPDGQLFTVDKFFPHPDYNATFTSNDIGLAHLAEPVTTLTPVPYMKQTLTNAYVGQKVLYVGYGVSDGIEQTGGGVKRSGKMPIVDIDYSTYMSQFEDAGVCFGDSGGPGLLEVDGVWTVVGVNSGVYKETGDPCTGIAVHTRVDTYADWISEHVDGPPPSCVTVHDLCYCQAGCNADGTCDNSLCQTWTCKEVYNCWSDCKNSECRIDCYLRAGEYASTVLDDMIWCAYMACGQSGDFDQCMKENCKAMLSACIPVEVGEESCSYISECLRKADSEPESIACYADATAEAQNQMDDLLACYADNACNYFPEPAFYPDCGWKKCSEQLLACQPPDDCSILGGSCPVDHACAPAPGGEFYCFPSDEILEGEPCDPSALERLPCDDGLTCTQLYDVPRCERLCGHDGHCPKGQCLIPLWSGIDDVGVCNCVDLDKDESCKPQDCDDTDPNRSPSAPETCGNKVDDNCNGDTDEAPCEGGQPEPEDDASSEPDASAVEQDKGAKGSSCAFAPDASSSSPLFLVLAVSVLLALAARRQESPNR